MYNYFDVVGVYLCVRVLEKGGEGGGGGGDFK